MNHLAPSNAGEKTLGADLRDSAMANAFGDDLPSDLMAAANGHDQPNGLCLVDDQGRLLAANSVYRDEFSALLPPALLAEGVRRKLAGETLSKLPRNSTIVLQMDRLDGSSGPLTLVTLRRREATSPPLHRDALTHLPDRRAIVDRADDWRRASPGVMPRFAVLFLDLDDFKGVNDRHGHAVGDEVLRQLAARWLQCVRDGDLVARYGGDEFVLLIKDAATSHEVDPIIRRVKDATRLPIVVGEMPLLVDASIGWSAPAETHWAIEALVAAADRDMYARKGRVLR